MKFSSSLLLLLFFIVLLASSCRTFYPPFVHHKLKKEEPFDAIIVPGFPFKEEGQNVFMKTRVLWAKYLYDQGICKNIIFSGSAVYSPYYESEIMAMYAVKLGMPQEHVFLESKAEHTTENLYYGLAVAEENGFERVGFATDVYQTTFIAAYLRKMNMQDLELIPMRYSKIKPIKEIGVDEVDFESALKPNFMSIMDRQTLQERMKGTNGVYIGLDTVRREH